MTDPQSNGKANQGDSPSKWEAWQLTAFVLGELAQADADRISQALKQDPLLAKEVAELQCTIERVSEVYSAESGLASVPGQPDQRLNALLANVSVEEKMPRNAQRAKQLRWLGMLAMAASLLVAVSLSFPRLTNWFFEDELALMPRTTDPESRSHSLMRSLDLETASPNLDGSSQSEEAPEPESHPFSLSADDDQSIAHEDAQTESDSSSSQPSQTGPSSLFGDMSPTPDRQSNPNSAGRINSDGISDLGIKTDQLRGGYGGPGYASGERGQADDVNSLDTRLSTLARASRGEDQAAAGGGGYGQELAKAKPFSGGQAVDGPEVRLTQPATMDGATVDESPAEMGLPSTYRRRTDAYLSLAENVVDKEEIMAAQPSGTEGYETKLRQGPHPVRGWSGRGAKSGPRSDSSGDRFETLYENPFIQVENAQLSTFSVDVDTASYTKVRQLLLEGRRLPPPGAVRIEEFVNYFDYEYSGPGDSEEPFGTHLAVSNCPWQPTHKLVRIALQAEKLDVRNRPSANIVFLLDVSGSMDAPNKLPLVKESMRMLIKQLGENDRIAMVVYAGAAGCVLEGTRGDKQTKILQALEELQAGGSTNGGQGIQLAYQLARDQFVEDGINRVILCTDGDFNVGVTSTSSLVDLVEENARSQVFLTVLGFGMGNTNDVMMEEISNRGNGVYGFVDNRREAHRQMVRQLAGNLMTVAKDVKVQVEFNPVHVRAYRLLGYENRMLKARDFADDTKDAGEIGSGHRVTALYEIVLEGESDPTTEDLPGNNPPLRYPPQGQVEPRETEPQIEAEDPELANELLAVKLRYKQPDGDTSRLLVYPLQNESLAFEQTGRDFRWAATMVEFCLLLRDSRYRGTASWDSLLEHAMSAAGISPDADRQESLEMIRTAAAIAERADRP